MLLFPNCKINIGLHVVSKRADGFHNIETIMYPVRGLCDALEILPAKQEGMTFTASGLAVGVSPEQNICVSAYRCVCDRYPIAGVKMHLHKVIPMGAGLGGGSSDAAYVIRGLLELWQTRMPDAEPVRLAQMEELAAQVGSDAPFFVANRPALATGRGELLSPVSCSFRGYRLVIVKPDESVSTAEAYGGVTPRVPDEPLSRLLQLPVEAWRDRITNDFEASVFKKHPRIKQIKELLYQQGACYAAMSGSGSAVYGIFKGNDPILLDFDDLFVYQEDMI